MEKIMAVCMLLSGGALLAAAGGIFLSALGALSRARRIRRLELGAARRDANLKRHEELIARALRSGAAEPEADPGVPPEREREEREKNRKWLEGLNNVLAYEPGRSGEERG